MLSNEYLFDTAMKNLIYGLVRIDPNMRIADKNSAARRYKFLPRIGSNIRNLCGKHLKDLYEVKDGTRKAAVISFDHGEKTVYAAVFREDNGCLIMIFHPLLFFVGESVDEPTLEKAVTSCALKLAHILKYKDFPQKPVRNAEKGDFGLQSCFKRISEMNGTVSAKLHDIVSHFNVIDKSSLVVTNESDHTDALIDVSKLFFSFVELISFSVHILKTDRLTAAADFGNTFMTVTVAGNIDSRISPSQKLYFELFATVMHCMGIGAKILRSNEKHFEAAISIPYEQTYSGHFSVG